MPQMAPIWWFTLFMVFILTYCVYMMLIYFYNIYQPKTEKFNKNLNIKNISWKW
uniref:ATP synthase complex subunit 8 n=2 Tax=unclassified Insulaphylus TaxID=2626600 RepID=A0A514LPJ5_9HEMI|nr:ATP synthase F0 subunit 8 [Insulaphylus sp. ph6]QDI93742.1 ATP synthase F0 subunit 8 [Insulaphylus sp. ph34]